MKLRAYIVALHAALFAILLAASPAGSGSMTLMGAGKPAAGGAAPTWVGTDAQLNTSCGFSLTCAVTVSITAGRVVAGVGAFNGGTAGTITGVALSGACGSVPFTLDIDATPSAGLHSTSLWSATVATGGSCTLTITGSASVQWQIFGAAVGTFANLTSNTATTTCTGVYTSASNSPYPCTSSVTVPSSGFAIVFGWSEGGSAITASGGTFIVDNSTPSLAQNVAIGHNATAGSLTPSFAGLGFVESIIVAATWH